MNKLKIFFILLQIVIISENSFTQVVTTNRNPVGLEHNMLFNAQSKYAVTQTGHGQLVLATLFDGKFAPSYSTDAPTPNQPCIIEIAGLPKIHTQVGAWVGWSTRGWPANRFKIEGFDEYYGNGWVTIADYQNTDYNGNDFNVKCPLGAYTKLRFTIYQATGTSGRLGISELHFIHPEATRPYEGIFSSDTWMKNNSKLSYTGGYVGINTTNPTCNLDIYDNVRPAMVLQNPLARFELTIARNNGDCAPNSRAGDAVVVLGNKSATQSYHGLIFNMNDDNNDGNSYIKFADWANNEIMGIYNNAIVRVNGKFIAKAINVKTNVWGDFVFDKDYALPSLTDLEKYIKEHQHLPGVPSGKDVIENGINVSEMNVILMQKIEELTLYMIEQDKKMKELEKEVNNLKK